RGAGGGGGRTAGRRRRGLPARPRGAPARAVRVRRGRVHRPDAALAGGSPRQRRRLGAVRVRRGRAVHRLRAVPSSVPAAGGRRRGGRGGLSAAVRAPARGPDARLTCAVRGETMAASHRPRGWAAHCRRSRSETATTAMLPRKGQPEVDGRNRTQPMPPTEQRVPPEIDTNVPSIARVYDAMLEGKDNFDVD